MSDEFQERPEAPESQPVQEMWPEAVPESLSQDSVPKPADSPGDESPLPGRSVEPVDRDSERLRELNQAIELHADAAVNYLLRGELFLKGGQIHLAKADFETALALAEQQLATDAWGVTAQFVIDRALLALREADRTPVD